MTTILIKKRDTAGAPTAGDLTNAAGGVEIAVNTSTKRVYSKDSGGNIIELGTNPTSITTGAVSATQVNITGQGDLRLEDTTGGEYVALQAPTSLASSYTLTLPADDGTNGQALITDGSGNLSWSTAASGDVYGPASATDNAVARFDLTTGKLIQNSVVTIGDTGDVAGVGALSMSGAVTLSGGTANGVAYLNGSKVLTTGSALVFDGSNLGLGVTPSAWGFGGNFISAGGFYSTKSDSLSLLNNAYYNGGYLYASSGNASRYATSGGAHYWYTAPSGTAGSAISFTQAMTLDASGNLGIGTTNPLNKLHVNGSIRTNASPGLILDGTASSAYITSSTSGVPQWFIGSGGSTGIQVYTYTADPITFSTNNTERMRIDSSGNLLVGYTSVTNGKLAVNGAVRINIDNYKVNSNEKFTVEGASGFSNSANVLYVNSAISGSNTFATFYVLGGSVGSISTTGSTTAYNTSSDYRLKENIQPMQNALGVVAQLNPVTYTWKADGSDGQGFIAHELQAVVPDCVTGEKDAVDEEGKPVYQGIDTSFLVATLTKAIQELKAELDATKAEVAALKQGV